MTDQGTQKTNLVIYHSNCFDGFGAALAAYTALGDTATYVEGVFGQDPPDVTGKRVFIVDFSYKREVLVGMHKKASMLTVLDHHKSAEADLEGLEYAKFDLSKSGATLTWSHFYPGTEIPLLLRYIEDRDLWKFRLPDSKAVSIGLAARPRTFDAWMPLMHDVSSLASEGKLMLVYQASIIEQMCSQAVMTDIGGYTVPVVNATSCFSEVCNRLLELFPTADFACYYFDRKDGVRQWGSRARPGFDVSQVAVALGGGGHPTASGWQSVVPKLM